MRILILSIFAFSSLSYANARAPIFHDSGTSAVLTSLPKISVLGERLYVQCGGNCDVLAEYTVYSDKPVEFATDFILPKNKEISFSVNGKAEIAPLMVLKKKDIPAWVYRNKHVSNEPAQLFKGVISGKLKKGTNLIRVTYKQPLSKIEFRNTEHRLSPYFTYELWPLREWKLGKGFKLDIEVRFTSPATQKRPICGVDNGEELTVVKDSKRGWLAKGTYSKVGDRLWCVDRR